MPGSPRHNTTPQLRLPGQAAAPEGPIDVSTMYFMHFGFRRDLDAFVAAARTPVTDRARWRALRERWAKFALVLQHHHTVEDEALWPRLVERARSAGDEDAVATLDAMEAEHSEIDPMLEGCTADLNRLSEAPDEDARSAFEVRVVAFRERLGRHLAHEETDAMALVQRYLTPEDWKMTEKAANKRATGEYVRSLCPGVGISCQPGLTIQGGIKTVRHRGELPFPTNHLDSHSASPHSGRSEPVPGG